MVDGMIPRTFPRDSYYSINYYTVEVKLQPRRSETYGLIGDYLDVISIVGATLEDILVSLNNGDFITLLELIPAVTPFNRITLINTTDNEVTIKFKIGRDYFHVMKNRVVLTKDETGIVKFTDIQPYLNHSEIKDLEVTIDNSTGTTDLVQQLVSTSTPSKKAVILNDPDGAYTCYIGDSTPSFKLKPGAGYETKIDDLSKIYVRVPAGAKVTLYVIYEV